MFSDDKQDIENHIKDGPRIHIKKIKGSPNVRKVEQLPKVKIVLIFSSLN